MLSSLCVSSQVENESLKRAVYEKQQLLGQASSALTQLEDEYKDQLSCLLQQHDVKVQQLEHTIHQLNEVCKLLLVCLTLLKYTFKLTFHMTSYVAQV